MQPLQASAHPPSTSSFLGHVIRRSGIPWTHKLCPCNRRHSSEPGWSRAASGAVSRPQGLRASRTLIRGFRLCHPCQQQQGRPRPAQGMRLCPSLPSLFPQDAAPSMDALNKQGGRSTFRKGTCCSCTDKEDAVAALSSSIPGVSTHRDLAPG